MNKWLWKFFPSFTVMVLIVFSLNVYALDSKIQNETIEILNLEECIKQGIANYPKIKAAYFDKVVAEGKLSEAKSARFFPKFEVIQLFGPIPDVAPGFGPPDFPKYNVDWSEWGVFYQIGIEIFQPLYTFGKIQNIIEAALGGVKAKELQIEVEKRNLVFQIKQIYYGLSFGYAGLDLMDEMDKKLSTAKKKVRKLLDKGSSDVTELDMLKLKVVEADLKKRFVDSRTKIDIGKRALSVLLGREPTNGFDIESKRCIPVKLDIKTANEYYGIAENNRQELKQLDQALKIRKSLQKVARADFFPTLFVGGFFDYGISPGRTRIDNPYLKDNFNILRGGGAFGIRQDLSFFRTNAKYKQARAEYKMLESQKELLRNALLLEVRKAYEELVSSGKVVQITKDGFKDARSWLASAFLGFDMGTVSTGDLIEAFAAYTKTKVDYLGEIYAYNTSVANLSKATGLDMEGISY